MHDENAASVRKKRACLFRRCGSESRGPATLSTSLACGFHCTMKVDKMALKSECCRVPERAALIFYASNN